MTEEVPDVDAMLEQAMDTSSSAPANGDAAAEEYGPAAPNGDSKDKEVKKSEKKESSRRRSRSRSRSRDRKRKRSSSKDRKRSRSRSRDRRRRRSRSRSKDRRRRTRSPRRSRSPKRRSRSPRRRRSRTRSPIRRRTRSPVRRRSRSPYRPRRSRSPRRDRSPMRGGGRLPGPERRDVMPFTAKNSPPPDAKHDLSAEERDLRTVFILQIARSTRPSDLEDFFSSVGNVRDVRIITDSKTRRSKGISYVEFWEEESVNLALALNGQKLLNAPLVIQRTCAERNRAAAQPATVGGSLGFGPVAGSEGPVTLKVANLHPNITDSMLQGIFDPFGKIDELKLFMDMQGVSQGFAHVKFKYSEDAAKALEQLNGFELAGKTMKITTVDEGETQQRSLDSVTGDAGKGIALGQGGRMELMAKLAQSGGVVLPQATQDALAQQHDASIPAIATQCFMLSNMFDPATESEPGWADDVKEDVVEECHRNGGALHVYVDTASAQGNVYVKCPTVMAAHKSVQALHGRWFSGKVITANYVPVQSYHELFPEAMKSLTVLQPRPQVPAAAAPPPPPMAGIPPMMGAPPPPPMGYGGFPPPPQYGGQGYYG